MILVDSNILVYSFAGGIPGHERAKEWLDDSLSRRYRVGIPWSSLVSFVRLVTNPRVFSQPASPAEACAQVERWLSSPAAWSPAPTKRHAAVFEDLLKKYDVRADSVPDAHMAALAIEHGLILASTDRDFARFRELRWINPLEEESEDR